MTTQPTILYSFRRCPYAMRARMALTYAGIAIEHREIVLRDKPAAMLAISPKGTVPVLQLTNGEVIEESIDIVRWAIKQNDPDLWWPDDATLQKQINDLIAINDGPFKAALDRYKYPDRYDNTDAKQQRDIADTYLLSLEELLQQNTYLISNHITLADIALFPFVRQFSKVEPEWFTQTPLPALQQWLSMFCDSDLFKFVMKKHETWQPQ